MDSRRSNIEIEGLLRSHYSNKLDACERLHSFVDDAMYEWAGRSLEGRSADSIILAEAARATKSYGAVLRLSAAGFGPQASMLVRSLFEGMAVAHWAHANPGQAVELFEKHSRHGELLWGDAMEMVEAGEPRSIDAGTKAERDELGGLFGKYGTKLWTGHGSLRELLIEIETQWGGEDERRHLWTYFRIILRDNNQVLHSTAFGLAATVVGRDEGEIVLDVGPSNHYVDRALVGGTWSFMQMATLLWDHFEIPDRAKLDERFDDAWGTFLKQRTDSSTDDTSGL